MKLETLKEQVISGEITVDFGKAFIYLKNPMRFLLQKFDDQIAQDIKYEKWSLEYHAELEAKGEGHKRLVWDKTLDPWDYFATEDSNYALSKNSGLGERFKINSWIVGEELYVALKDNVLHFRQFNHDGDRMNCTNIYVEPAIPDDISVPPTDYINIPSGKLMFTNRFSEEKINPEPEDPYHWNNSISGTIGRKRHLHH